MNDTTVLMVQLVISLVAFVAGKYIFPKVPKSVIDKLETLSQWASRFVVWAREFMQSSKGEEKMEKVVELLKQIADEAGVNVTEEQLKAIAQAAYESMKAGGKEAVEVSGAATTAAPTVIINTYPTEEKAAVLTDDVPDGALTDNEDGTVNVYDENGEKTGTITKEEAEKVEKGVTVIVDGESL